MKFLLALVVLFSAASSMGQCVSNASQTCTPNINLYLPFHGSYQDEWEIPYNNNWSLLDQTLSGTGSAPLALKPVYNIDNMLFVDGVKYANWAAAAAACSGSNCTIVIPSTYAGVDCPSAADGLYTIDMRGLGPTNLPCGQNTDTYNGQTATVFSFLRHSQQVNAPLDKSYELTTNVAQYSGTFPASTQSLEGITSVAVTTGAVIIPNANTALVGLEAHGWVQSTGATLPSLYGFVVGNQLYSGSTTNVATSYGLRVQSLIKAGSGTVTNNYGLYLDPQTGGTARNFSFYSGAGLFANDTVSSGINFEDSALAAHPVLTALAATNQMRFRPLLDSAGFAFDNGASSADWLLLNSSGVSIPTLPFILGNHLNQSTIKDFAGTCVMASGISCTFTLASGAYSSTPICVSTVQSATVIASGCTVSGTTVTITAASSNSSTWGAMLIGNPN